MATLKLTPTYLNPYEQMYKQLSASNWFKQREWENAMSAGELDQYVTTIAKLDKNKSFTYDDFNKKYGADYADDETLLAAKYNEAFANRTNVDEKRERYVKNEDGSIKMLDGKPVTETYNASDYDYYAEIIKERNDINYQNYLIDKERERKDQMSVFVKGLASIAGLAGEFLSAAGGTIDNVAASIKAFSDAAASETAKQIANKYGIKNNIDNFADTYVKSINSDDWRLFEQLGFQDAIIDFESKYTYLRDVTGEYTDGGKVLGGLATTLGQMLPAMLVGHGVGAAAKAASASTAVSSTLTKATSSLVFYQGVTAGNILEMYQQFARDGVTVPSSAIIANSYIKSAAQYAVEILLPKLLGDSGGSYLDKLVFGRPASSGKVTGKLTSETANKVLSKAAGKRVLKDFLEEGLEEVFQDTSDFLVDQAFATLINENFANITTITPQSLIDSFIMGGLASFAGNAFGILTTKREYSGNLVDGKTDVKLEKLSKLASWEYGLDMQSFVQNAQQIIELKDTVSPEKYAAAFTEMYSSYRILSSLYSEIGAERFKQANDILTEVTKMINNGKFDPSKVKENTQILFNNLQGLKVDTLKNLEQKIKDAAMTSIATVVHRDDDLDTTNISQETKNTLKQLFEGDSKLNTIYVTDDGKNVVAGKEEMFVPAKYAKNADGSIIYSTVAEQELVSYVLSGKYKGFPLEDVKQSLSKITGTDVSTEEAVYRLLFDASFFRTMLSTANKDMYNFLSTLSDIATSLDTKNVKDAIYKQKLQTVITNMKSALYDYLANQPYAEYKLPIFTKEEQRKIAALRWCKNLYARIIDNKSYKKLTENDWNVLNERVNSLPIAEADKKRILANLKSEQSDVRRSAMNRISALYKGVFTSKYDGTIYMPDTSNPNKSFNIFLQDNGLTIDTLLSINVDNDVKSAVVSEYGELTKDTMKQFRQSQFSVFCNNAYTFEYDSKGKIGIYSTNTKQQVGFSNYNAQQESVLAGTELDKRTFVEKTGKRSTLVSGIIDQSLDGATKAYLSIDDVITNPNLLSPEIRVKIQSDYGDTSIESTFMYLRKYFIDELGNTTVIQLQDGTFSFASVKPMLSALIKTDFVIDKDTTIKSIIRPGYLYGRLADVKIKLTDNNIVAVYNSLENTIYVNRQVAAKGGNFLQFALLHEFQHAVQIENGMNIGMNADWINGGNVSKTMRSNIIKDIRKHRPELFEGDQKGSDTEVKIANDFVYFASGESTAMGIDASSLLDFYPVVVNYDIRTGTEIRMPWGTVYKLDGTTSMSLFVKNYMDESIELLNEDDFNKYRDSFELTKDNWLEIAKRKDKKNATYDSYETLRRMFGDIEKYINKPLGTVQIDRETKQKALNKLKIIRDESLHTLYSELDMKCSYDEFLDIPIPIVRIQSNEIIYDDVFVSFTAIDSQGRLDRLYNEVLEYVNENYPESVTSKRFLYFGFIKPRDLYGYIGTSLQEVAVPTSISSKFSKMEFSLTNEGVKAISGTIIDAEPNKDRYNKLTPTLRYNSLEVERNISDAIYSLGLIDNNRTQIYLSKSVVKKLHELMYATGIRAQIDTIIPRKGKDNYYSVFDAVSNIKFNDYTKNDVLSTSDVRFNALKQGKQIFVDIAIDNNININNLTVASFNIEGTSFGVIVNTINDIAAVSAMCSEMRRMMYVDGKLRSVPDADFDLQVSNVPLSTLDIVIPGAYNVFVTKQQLNRDFVIDPATGDTYDVSTDERIYSGNKTNLGPNDEMSLKAASDKDTDITKTAEYDSALRIYNKDKSLTVTQLTEKLKQAYPFTDARRLSSIAKSVVNGTKVDTETEAKPAKKRYVSQKASAKTNLEKYGYVGKYKRTQMSEELQHFIVNANNKIDAKLWDKVKSGKLTTQDVMDYFRSADNIDNDTFKLINDSYFKNPYIKTFDELKQYVDDKTAKYYAMSNVFKQVGMDEKFMSSVDVNLLDKFLQVIETSSQLKKLFDKSYSYYYEYKGHSIDVSEKLLRRLWMQYYDGTPSSGAHVAAIAKAATVNRWLITGEGGTIARSSIDDIAKGDLSYSEVIADDSATQAFEDIFNSFDREEKINEIMKIKSPEYIKKLLTKGFTNEQIKKKIHSIWTTLQDMDDKEFAMQYAKIVKGMSEEEINAIFAKQLVITTAALKESEIGDKEMENAGVIAGKVLKNEVRPSNAIANNIKSIDRTIRANLSRKTAKLFLQKHSDIFNSNLTVKDEVMYTTDKDGKRVLKDRESLLKLENTIKQLSKDVREGAYNSKKAYDYKKSTDKRIEKLKAKNAKLVQDTLNGKNNKVVVYNIADETITVNTKKSLPPILKRLLSKQFQNKAKSKTQYLIDGDKQHVQANLKWFLDENALLLKSMTQSDVDELVDFYLTSEIIPDTNRARQYTATQVYLMAYLLKGNDIGNFTLSETQRTELNKRLESIVSISAATLSNWQQAMKMLKPAEVIAQSLAKNSDIEFTTGEIDELITASATKDAARIEATKKKVYEAVLARYKGNKRTLLSKLLRFEQTAMLSGPGTWARNWFSNILVTTGNKTAEQIGSTVSSFIEKMFPKKKWKRDNQYELVHTKVDAKTQQFVVDNFINNGLYELINDGLTKYDTRKVDAGLVDSDDVLALTIAQSIKNKLFQENAFDNNIANNVQKFVFRMLSDDKAIMKATVRYFGKMLIEDKIDINNGITTDVMNRFAEAYKLAAYDYMHKQNFINKLESQLKSELGEKAYFVYKQIMPFAGASLNWFMEGINYTPVGLIKAIVNFAKLETTIEKMDLKRQRGEQVISSRFAEYIARRNIGKGIIGSIGWGIGLALAALGFAGIDEEDKYNKYKLYVTIGGERVYLDISDTFGTQGILLGISFISCFQGRNFKDILNETIDILFEDSLFSSLFNTFRYNSSVADMFTSMPYDILSAFIPNFVKTFSSITYGHKVSYSKGILGKFERLAVNAIPGLVYAFPKQIDVYTGETQIAYKMWFVTNIANKLLPFKINPYNVSEMEKEAISLGVNKGTLSGKYKEIALNARQTEELNLYYGKLNKQYLEELVKGKVKYKVYDAKKGEYVEISYNKMTDEQKKSVIQNIMSDNAKVAKVKILTENGFKYYATSSEYDKLKKLRLKNIYLKTDKKSGFVKD